MMVNSEDIIQALEICSARKCAECPYRGKGIACKYILMIDAAEALKKAAQETAP